MIDPDSLSLLSVFRPIERKRTVMKKRFYAGCMGRSGALSLLQSRDADCDVCRRPRAFRNGTNGKFTGQWRVRMC